MLVVEDEQDIAGLIKHALEREGGFVIDIAGSGDAALKSVADEVPDLVLLDLNLPVLNGVEVCRIMRGRPETAKLPIIMLTARSTESDRITGLDIGADDYITKPFSLRELAARVRAVLRRRVEDQQRDGDTDLPRQAHRCRLRSRRGTGGRRARAPHAARIRAASIIWLQTETECSPGIACSSASGGTATPSKRAQSTCTSDGFAENSTCRTTD